MKLRVKYYAWMLKWLHLKGHSYLNSLLVVGLKLAICACEQNGWTRVESFRRVHHDERTMHKGLWVLFGLFFMFSNFYQWDLHNKLCLPLANLQLCVNKYRIEDEISPIIYLWLLEVHVCWFLNLNTHILPIVFIIECEVVNKAWRWSPIYMEHITFWCLFFWSSPNHIPINYKGPKKKVVK